MRDMDIRSCLVEAVKNIHEHAPEDHDLDDIITLHPYDKSLEAFTSRELTYFVGYLMGMADAEDVTVLELLDGYNISYAKPPTKQG